MNRLFFYLWIAFSWSIAPITAQDSLVKPYNSLLWEITGKGIKKPSYLYGTIHLIPKEDFIMSDIVKKKFAEAEQLALEIDMDDPFLMFRAMSGLTMKGGVTLDKLLTPAEYALVETYFEDSLDVPMTFLKRIKPMLITGIAAEQSKKQKMESFEIKFMQMAKEKQKKVIGLETAEYQIGILDSIPYKEQAEMLLESIKSENGDLNMDMFAEMIALYKAQDLDGLYKTISEDSGGEKFESILLHKRNQNWIPVIEKQIKKTPTFIAVGAGHLPGDLGVINLLRKAGYKVKPLK